MIMIFGIVRKFTAYNYHNYNGSILLTDFAAQMEETYGYIPETNEVFIRKTNHQCKHNSNKCKHYSYLRINKFHTNATWMDVNNESNL